MAKVISKTVVYMSLPFRTRYLLRYLGENEPCTVGQYDHPEHLPVGPTGQGPKYIRYAREGVVLLALPRTSRAREGQLHVRTMCCVHQGKQSPSEQWVNLPSPSWLHGTDLRFLKPSCTRYIVTLCCAPDIKLVTLMFFVIFRYFPGPSCF